MSELDQLPESVRRALTWTKYAACSEEERGYAETLRAEILRLAGRVAELERENAELREENDMFGRKADEYWRDLAALREFARDVMRAWPLGDVDGGDLQGAAEKHGLIRLKSPLPTEPCGEGCRCAEYFSDDEWTEGARCYEYTDLLRKTEPRALLDAKEGE